jgi:hypothetical protein
MRPLLSINLMVAATLLSAFDGVLSLLSVLIFSDHESTRLWASIIVPAFLWIPALTCFKFPRAGLAVFLLLVGIAVALGNSWHNLRFALIGGALLLVNLSFLKRSSATVPNLKE